MRNRSTAFRLRIGLIAVSLSGGGSEEGTLHVYEVETGRELSDFIPRVNYPTGGGSVAWNAEGSGLYYTRYPRAGERQVVGARRRAARGFAA